MKKYLTVFSVAILLLACCTPSFSGERWSVERVNKWYAKQPWPVGCNYVPATAINQVEMWQEETFDPETIDRELGWAEDLGFNTIRVFLHDIVWEADPEGFKKRIGQFLDICEKHKIRVIFTFFTNGGPGLMPKLGKQPEPTPGVHNPAWYMSPGVVYVNDPTTWGRLEKYVKDIISTFKDDQRILVWDLYNEPEKAGRQPGYKANTLPLLREVFKWAREVDPSQPLTAPFGCAKLMPLNVFLASHCDVFSFHSYETAEKEVNPFLRAYKRFDRPILCTEYMGRPKSTFQELLPIFKKKK